MMPGAAVVHERKALSHKIILILFNVNYFIKITKLIILKYWFFLFFIKFLSKNGRLGVNWLQNFNYFYNTYL